jgi:hypothetical protein
MKPIDLTKTLKPYKYGWVAIDEKNNKVVAHAESFGKISERMKNCENVYLLPASDNYFGFITQA